MHLHTRPHLQKSAPRYLKVAVLALLSGFVFFVFLQLRGFTVPSSALERGAVLYEYQVQLSELPIRLVIPAIDVDAEIQYVGLDEGGTGEMEVPSNFTDVGWYQDGVRPGDRGSAVIAGHFNGRGIPEAVFYDLDTLHIGDEVVVMSAEGDKNIFRVVKIETYAYDAPTTDVFLSSDEKVRLNLITCGGEWLPDADLFNERTVVFTELATDLE